MTGPLVWASILVSNKEGVYPSDPAKEYAQEPGILRFQEYEQSKAILAIAATMRVRVPVKFLMLAKGLFHEQ
ncbi:hypothetical protein MCC01998_02330 [Bifidobacteriaceae bacterium MCC01998]|nr:hypothetical protein MCC02032_11840 [Bifidobacteriaceae bacterium MCC02032]GDZ50804.1 hypothetical protein MCC02034_13400 [Bifidobacteriaceae bacterium MCC02034]GDZ52636.1 hypothetical protein MCC02035_13290 [Bifidobacteriaceae bacterium MCC02035]GDZ56351.1 hypothetical protein MCC01996_10510 [Bifidobacteriaceae bacterium MCC01996]GDZ62512.1 hypothetical protein MCC02037_11750 [Bifidobacteriaceae bacterium MCC02037]GDZ68308.1 hypothetical protein MCC01988_11750 [Bifidobacteriaceae bacterium